MKANHRSVFSAAWVGLALLLSVSHGAFGVAAPSNDNFASGAAISGNSGSVSGTVEGATAEAGEPVEADLGGNSVWYKWTAPITGAVTFDTGNSSFDTILAVYTGQSVANLTLVAQNDDDPDAGDGTSRVVFAVTSGKTYRIAVVGQDGDSDLTLNWRTSPSLIHFASPTYYVDENDVNGVAKTAVIKLERVGSTSSAVTVAFHAQDSEDANAATGGDDYVPTPDEGVTVTFGVGVSSVTTTVSTIADTDVEGDEVVALTLTDPSAGTVIGMENSAVLVIHDDDDNPPNDLFSNAEVLGTDSGTTDGTTTGSGTEDGEPAHAGVSGGHSIWYKFTPAAKGTLLLDTVGSTDGIDDLDTVLAVYTGSVVSALTPVASNDNGNANEVISRLGVPVAAGTTYYIALDSKGVEGDTTLNWSFATGGTVQLSSNAYSIVEDEGALTVTVTRTGGLDGPISVNYTTSDNGSAVGGQDYNITSGSLSFAANEALKTFTVPIVNDTINEGDETFLVTLSGPTGGAILGSVSQATVTIDDDEDNPPNDFFAAAAMISGPSGEDDTSNVGARREVGEPVHGGAGKHSIWYKWRAPAAGVVTFDTAGSTDQNGDPLDTLLAAYTGDTLSNLTQIGTNDNVTGSVNARLSFVVKAGVTYDIAVDGAGDAQGDITFTWSFGQGGLLQFSQVRYDVNEGDLTNGVPTVTTATITVNRTDGLTGDVTVDYSVDDGTATDGDDYVSTADTLTFASGQASKTFTVQILGDTLNEGDETVLLSLSNATGGAVLGDISQATLVINDNDDDPSNDNFLSPQTLPGSTGVFTGLNTGASRQAGEPLHAGVAGHRSIWFTWTAPVSGIAAFETTGSLDAVSGPLDTLLAVYTGDTFASLVTVASNDNAAPGTVTSRVSFSAKAGKAYRIAVDSTGDAGGEVRLAYTLGAGGLLQFHQSSFYAREVDGSATITVDRVGSTTSAVSVNYTTASGTATEGSDFTHTEGTLTIPATQSSASFTVPLAKADGIEGDEAFTVTLSSPTGGAVLISETVSATVTIEDSDDDPVNDNFASAKVLAANAGTTTDSNVGASFETNESAATSPGRHSIWYTWTPTAGGIAIFDTIGSGNFGTVLTAFTGTTLANLQMAATSDSTARPDHTSRITFTALAGKTYFIEVDARAPIVGPTVLNWGLSTGGTFAFASSTYQVEENASTLIVTVRRTDANSNPASVALHTVDGTAVAGSDYGAVNTTLQFAAGQVVKSVAIGIVDDMDLEGDETFSVVLDNPLNGSVVGSPSTAVVTIRDNEDDPAGDHFSQALPVDEDGSAPSANNSTAGRDLGEKVPGLVGKIGSGRTIWYQWVAPSAGSYTFSTEGSADADGNALDTVLGIYTGTSISKLKLVAENDEDPDNAPTSAATFKAKAGRTYYIAVDTVGGATGDIELAATQNDDSDSGPLLLPIGKQIPIVSYKEAYHDTVVPDGPGFFVLGDPKGGFTVKVVAPLTDRVDVTGLTAASTVGLNVGNLSHSATLADADGGWTPGQTKATFTVDDGIVVTYSWTAAALTITATGKNPSTLQIATDSYAGSPLEGGETLDLDITFAGATGARTMYLSGSSTSNDNTGASNLSLSGTADYTAPRGTFKTPPANARLAVDTVSFFGTASDNRSLANADSPVQISVNGGELTSPDDFELRTFGPDETEDPKNATWELDDVPLQPGLNTIVLYVTDDSGNVGTFTRVVNRVTSSPLTIAIEGQGTVTGPVSGTVIELGKPITLTAKPAPGYLFKEWTGGISATTPKVTFLQQDGLSVTARFIPNPFPTVQGNYSGLVQAGIFAAGQTGNLQVALGSLGTFTGKLTIGGVTYSLPVGVKFDEFGDATVTIVRKPPLSPLTVTLHLDLTGKSEQITGTVSDGDFTSSLVADHATFSPANPAPQAGAHTVILSSGQPLDSADPAVGHGYCTATVTAAGTVALVGNVPDGGKISVSAPLSRSGVLSIYQPFKGGSVIVGSAVFSTDATGDISGTLTWNRPIIGALDLGIVGELYVPPLAGARAAAFSDDTAETAIAGGGYSGAPRVQAATLTDKNLFLFTGTLTPILTLKVDPKSGLITGTVLNPSIPGKTVPIKGILLQHSLTGGGYFLNGTNSGANGTNSGAFSLSDP